MNLDRKLPSVMWSRGRRIVQAGKVRIEHVDEAAGVVTATVYGTAAYDVTVAEDEDDDYCTCPFFFDHDYCEHIAAVILAMKQDRPALQQVTLRSAQQPAKPASAGARLVEAMAIPAPQYFKGLGSTDAPLRPLTLEVTLALMDYRTTSYSYVPRFFVSLRCGEPGAHLYVINDVPTFLAAYDGRRAYQTNGKAVLQLAPAAFGAAEQQVLAALLSASPAENDRFEYYVSTPHKWALLNVGQASALAPTLAQLQVFHYQPLPETWFDQFDVQPYTAATAPLRLQVQRAAERYVVTFESQIERLVPGENLAITASPRVYQVRPGLFPVLANVVETLARASDRGDLAQGVAFNLDETAKLQQFLVYCAQVGQVSGAEDVIAPRLTPHFTLSRQADQIDLTLQFEYAGQLFAEGAPAPNRPRNPEQEQQAQAYLRSLGFWHGQGQWHQEFADGATLYHFFTAELPNLKENGVVTVAPSLAALQQNGAALNPQVAVATAGGLLTVAFGFDGIQPADVDRVLAQLDVDKPYIERPDGGIVMMDDQLRHLSRTLVRLRQQSKVKHGHLQVSAAQALVLQASLGDQAQFDDQFQRLASDLRDPSRFPVVVPASVHAQLRPYQVAGVQWLEMLDAHGFGGILADEMGLGKTLQLLTFLAARHQAGLPDLVVAPASLLYNWRAECEKFTPSLKAVVVDGTKADRDALIAAGAADILITSYSSVLRDKDAYAARQLGYLVLDEAQYVKNGSAKTNQALRQFKAKNTFALSGTPIENRPEELWAIFALVMPGLLPSKRAFNQLDPGEVAVRVSPFILRREKTKVLKDLPAKTEFNLENEMTKGQKTVYLAQLQQMQVKVRGMSNTALVKNKLAILAGLTRLRQICDTPALYLDHYHGGSGKLDQLEDLVQEALDGGKQVLIFSQFTQMLAQIQKRLHAKQLPYYTLAGDTKPKDRLQMVDAFNAGQKPLFLISLKAGGTGLNLTGASVVILVDLWWNPAVEDQATGRAHRIGQTHAVDVYRLITKGTIEEQIVKLQEKKRDLVNQVLSGAEQKSSLTTAEIKLILGLDD